MEGSNGSYLISVGTNYIHTYAIGSGGAVGNQASEVNTQNFRGAKCGNTDGVGSVLDRTGKYLYVQLFGAQYQQGNTLCAAWQSYRIESNGTLTFLGHIIYNSNADGSAYASTVPAITSNDKFGYGVFSEEYGTNQFSTFMLRSNGVLGVNQKFSEIDPKGNPDGNWHYFPVDAPVVAAGLTDNLAVLMFSWSNPPSGPQGKYFQVASYAINSTGGIKSTNTWTEMPRLKVNQNNGGLIAMQMSPSGKLLAIAGYPGLQLFHFHGTAPVTSYGPALLPTVNIDQLGWDKNNHLYALSYSAGELYVYEVTPTSIHEAPGSPYNVANPYGVKGLVVVPKL
jgi:hypothetical protein